MCAGGADISTTERVRPFSVKSTYSILLILCIALFTAYIHVQKEGGQGSSEDDTSIVQEGMVLIQ